METIDKQMVRMAEKVLAVQKTLKEPYGKDYLGRKTEDKKTIQRAEKVLAIHKAFKRLYGEDYLDKTTEDAQTDMKALTDLQRITIPVPE